MDERQQRADASGARSLVVVCVLLLCVAAVLAGLWVRERRMRLRAEQRVAEAQQQLEQTLQRMMMPPLPLPGGVGGVSPVQREDLASETVELDGRPREAFRISDEAGRRFGFRPGDLIVVAEAPPEEPTTGEP